MEGLPKEESYVERRQLFKNIWIEDIEVTNKPKVIKTLRLDDVCRCIVNKKKNRHIKNLKTVCNQILDICDRHDADELLYQPISTKHFIPTSREIRGKSRKRRHRKKLKIKSKRSPSPPNEAINCDKKIELHFKEKSRNSSPVKQANLDRKYTYINIH